MQCLRSTFFVLFAMTVMSCAIADRAHTATPVRQSFDIQVPWIPAPVVIAGQEYPLTTKWSCDAVSPVQPSCITVRNTLD